MASITLYPLEVDTANSSYYTASTNYPITGLVGKSASSSGLGSGFNLTSGSGAVTKVYINFDVSSIPEGAIINSVTCTAGLYGSTTFLTRTSTRQVQLCKNTTTVGTAVSFSGTGSNVTADITDTGTWTRDELENLKLLVYVTRSTSNTSSNTYLYVRGADLIIDYTEPVYHTLTVTNNTDYVVDPETGGTYAEGAIVPITITADTLPTITLDSDEITNLFVLVLASGSYTGYPTASSYTGLSSGSTYVAYAVGYSAESPYSSTSNYYSSSSAAVDSCYALYTFDVSSVPSNAINIKVSCVVAGHAESTTYTHSAGGRYSVWALCSDGTEKSELVYVTTTSNTTVSIAETEWTYDELLNLQLRHYVGNYGGGTVGATLTITYELPSTGNSWVYHLTISGDHVVLIVEVPTDTLHIKVDGEWKTVTKVYQKVNGTWTLVSDLQAFFSDYSNGGNTDFVKGEIEIDETVVGEIDSSYVVSLSPSSGLDSGTYTLRYCDSTGTQLTDWDDIGTITI